MAKTPVFKFGSHLPVLIQVMSITDGPALEMGMGWNSSLVMHWMCATSKRELMSCENNPSYYKWAMEFDGGFHRVVCTDNWDEVDIERPWDVAFLDHGPAERRKEDIRRLAHFAKYIVIHDAEGRNNRHFQYKEIYHLFRWKYDYHNYLPKTSILSNFVDLGDFEVR